MGEGSLEVLGLWFYGTFRLAGIDIIAFVAFYSSVF
jgi:hypothetical protein